MSNISISFLFSNVPSVVQLLGHEIVASFEGQYKNILLEWVSSQFDSSTTYQDLRKIVPNLMHAIMWSSRVQREFNRQIR
jgi:hypothetical protein